MNIKKTLSILLTALLWSVLGAPPAPAVMIDMTTRNATVHYGDAIFQQISPQSTGTGVIDSFVRIQNTGTESGYNTDGTLQYNTKAGSFTHSIQVGDAPVVNINGTDYRQFLLDINQINCGNKNYLSLDQLEVYTANAGNLSGYPNLGTKVYSLDTAQSNNYVKLDYALNPGSGAGDMFFYLKDSLFTDDQMYLYLYSKFGVNNPSNDGFEEWAVLRNNEQTLIPEPMTLALCGLGLGLIGFMRRGRKEEK